VERRRGQTLGAGDRDVPADVRGRRGNRAAGCPQRRRAPRPDRARGRHPPPLEGV
jgi:hypothetical protein